MTGGHPAHTAMSTNHYTFGDNARAQARLDRLADAYQTSSRAFLRTVVPLTPDPHPRTVDLGCGPGHTTLLLAGVFRPRRLDAYDTSPRYVAAARRRLAASTLTSARRAEVHQEDATDAPYAALGAHLVYARHLLAHVARPDTLLASTGAALAGGGVVAVEETAGLQSPQPHFRRYYDLVARLQANYGQRTFVGRDLGELALAAGLAVVDFTVRENAIPAATMAALHEANIAAWSRDPFARTAFDPAELAELHEYFQAVAHGREDAPAVSAPIGQLIARATS